MNKKSEEEIKKELNDNLTQWKLENNHLTRTYKTGNWRLTMMVANSIGFICESAFHHPTLILNYPSVKISLQTHDTGGITDKDFELAKKIEETITWQSSISKYPDKWIQ